MIRQFLRNRGVITVLSSLLGIGGTVGTDMLADEIAAYREIKEAALECAAFVNERRARIAERLDK